MITTIIAVAAFMLGATIGVVALAIVAGDPW
jgi:hypothetical protein